MKLILKPMPLADAVQKLGGKTVVASTWRTADWEKLQREAGPAFADRALFSAGVDWAGFLERGQGKLLDAIALRKEQVAHGEAFVSRSSFIGDLRSLVLAAGKSDGTGGLTDLASRARLGLIFDMQTQGAMGFARFKFDQNPAVLDAFPAQELLPSTAENPRLDWDAKWDASGGPRPDGAGGRLVALKTDAVWKTPPFSRFGVPWPPFDFGSQRDLRDVDRDEAESLGLLAPGAVIEPIDEAFNAELAASMENLKPETIAKLQGAFGDQIEIRDGTARWRAAA